MIWWSWAKHNLSKNVASCMVILILPNFYESLKTSWREFSICLNPWVPQNEEQVQEVVICGSEMGQDLKSRIQSCLFGPKLPLWKRLCSNPWTMRFPGGAAQQTIDNHINISRGMALLPVHQAPGGGACPVLLTVAVLKDCRGSLKSCSSMPLKEDITPQLAAGEHW